MASRALSLEGYLNRLALLWHDNGEYQRIFGRKAVARSQGLRDIERKRVAPAGHPRIVRVPGDIVGKWRLIERSGRFRNEWVMECVCGCGKQIKAMPHKVTERDEHAPYKSGQRKKGKYGGPQLGEGYQRDG